MTATVETAGVAKHKFGTYGFDSPKSEVVKGVTHCPDLFRLWVETQAGDVYLYEGVPYNKYADFYFDASKGSYWNTEIKGKFKSAGKVWGRPAAGSHITSDEYATEHYPEEPVPEEEFEFDYVVTYKVSGTVEVRVKAANWEDAAYKASDAFSEPGLDKEAVSIKKA